MTRPRGYANLWTGAPGVCHHPDKPDDHRHSDSRDMFLIYHVTLHNHILCEFMCGSLSF